MAGHNDPMRTLRVRQHGLLVECADASEVAATYAALRSRSPDLGAVDLVPAARTVLVDGLTDLAGAELLIRSLGRERASLEEPAGRVVEVPVPYDGPDLAEVARQWQVDEAEV